MLAVAYAFFREGVFTAFGMLVNVFLAGLVTFNYYEPMAAFLQPTFKGFLDGYEDAFSMVLIFAVILALLRSALNAIVNKDPSYHPIMHQFGGAFVGLVTGYFLAGFFFCLLQTLPWHEFFMSFDPRLEGDAEVSMRRYLPPDRVWLAMMHRASLKMFSTSPAEAFDKDGSFEWRYARYRRYSDDPRRPPPGDPLPYCGELDPPPAATAPPTPPASGP